MTWEAAKKIPGAAEIAASFLLGESGKDAGTRSEGDSGGGSDSVKGDTDAIAAKIRAKMDVQRGKAEEPARQEPCYLERTGVGSSAGEATVIVCRSPGHEAEEGRVDLMMRQTSTLATTSSFVRVPSDEAAAVVIFPKAPSKERTTFLLVKPAPTWLHAPTYCLTHLSNIAGSHGGLKERWMDGPWPFAAVIAASGTSLALGVATKVGAFAV